MVVGKGEAACGEGFAKQAYRLWADPVEPQQLSLGDPGELFQACVSGPDERPGRWPANVSGEVAFGRIVFLLFHVNLSYGRRVQACR